MVTRDPRLVTLLGRAIAVAWLVEVALLVRIGSGGTFDGLLRIVDANPFAPLVAGAVLSIVAVVIAGRLLVGPASSALSASVVLGLIAAIGGPTLYLWGHGSGVVIGGIGLLIAVAAVYAVAGARAAAT